MACLSMSTESRFRLPPRTLAGWIAAIVDATDHEPLARARLRALAGAKTAAIGLDDQVVLVRFDSLGQLALGVEQGGSDSDGRGSTSSACVRDMIAGRTEPTHAVLNGAIGIQGSPTAVAALLHIIEVVLDVSSRSPQLRALAREFVANEPPRVRTPPSARSTVDTDQEDEVALLTRLGLIRD